MINDWKWQIANSVGTIDKLKKYVTLTKECEDEIKEVEKVYPWKISPYYLSIMNINDKNCPIRQQALPSIHEFDNIFNISQLPSFHQSDIGSENPLWKEGKTEISNVVWRYPDRVVFHLTNLCAMNCRHCSRKVKREQGTIVTSKELIDKGIDYISHNSKIRDVLLTGGDPLMLEDDRIEYVIARLRSIKHVEIIRIGTRVLCTLPQRITNELCQMLKKYHPIWINTQFNHPKEITSEAIEACEKLLSVGIPLGNQSVLLRNINDNVDTMKELLHKLVQTRIRPYYLYHADLVRGTEHFRTSISTGMNIIENLRGHTSGFAVPTYVICTPLGKTPLQPNYLITSGPGYIVLRNYEWRIWRDPDCIESGDLCLNK